uniref:Uncharacterized protein n=1 Tax=Trichogramma kaykai TaxID=54128 RepID=A0ABD2W2F7_9HYME
MESKRWRNKFNDKKSVHAQGKIGKSLGGQKRLSSVYILMGLKANKNGSGARARAPSSLRSMRSRGGGISRVLSVCVLQARTNLHQWTECAVLCGIRYCKLDHFRALCYSEKRLRRQV